MEYAFFFVTLGLGVGLLLYAGLLRLTQDVRLIPRSYGVKLKDPKAYARTVAHILCFLALALLTGAWVGFYAGPLAGLLALAAALALAIWLCVRLWRSSQNKNR